MLSKYMKWIFLIEAQIFFGIFPIYIKSAMFGIS